MDFTGSHMKILVRHTPCKNSGYATGWQPEMSLAGGGSDKTIAENLQQLAHTNAIICWVSTEMWSRL
jgi:hypothetical protein